MFATNRVRREAQVHYTLLTLHADDRIQYGFTFRAVLAEFRALRATVLRLYEESVLPQLLGHLSIQTRSRVNVLMNKVTRLGFIDYNGGIKVKPALLSVVLHA